MKLRARLGVTLVALVVPFAIGLAAWQHGAQRRAFEEGTAEQLVERMAAGERALCEENPETWPMLGPLGRPPGRGAKRLARWLRGTDAPVERPHRRGRRPPFDVWAYDGRFESLNPRAPRFPPALAEALADSEVASVAAPQGPGDARLVAVRMPWTQGPCGIVVVARPGAPTARVFLRALLPALAVSAVAIAIALLSAGPVVRRIRRLTQHVASASDPAAPALDLGGGDEIGELARAFEANRNEIRAQIDALERRDEALRSYLASTTHDVMIPVSVLTGHLAAMERELEAGRPLEPGRLAAALEELHYLASIVRNLGTVARLDSGVLPIEHRDVDLADLVERVAQRYASLARQRSVTLDHAAPERGLWVRGDPTLLEQALGNLVHNAVRYGRVGGHAAVVLDRQGERFRLRVLDDGPGIPEAERARVLERGFRGDAARTRHPQGLGLGLAIAREVAERHGFTLELGAGDGGGLRVDLRGDALPADRDAKDPRAGGPGEETPPPGDARV